VEDQRWTKKQVMQELAALRRSIGAHVEVNLILEPDLWPRKADPKRMGQVIMNLAANARDAMPDGGTLASRPRTWSWTMVFWLSTTRCRSGTAFC
jgi:nitrogen fixation/metabolism regulation signal transduction histidine kinase